MILLSLSSAVCEMRRQVPTIDSAACPALKAALTATASTVKMILKVTFIELSRRVRNRFSKHNYHDQARQERHCDVRSWPDPDGKIGASRQRPLDVSGPPGPTRHRCCH